MKKSQSTLFVVMSLIMLILVGFLFYVMSERNKDVHLGNQLKYYDQKNMRADITSFVENCVEHSVKESFQDTGIRQENLDEYNLDVSEKIISCVEPLFSQIQAQGYLIEEENVHVESEINPETVIVNIKYPLKIKAEAEEINFDRFQYSFDRYTEIKIPGGITDKEIRLISSNGKAELVIPEGVEIKDKDENPVEYVGINVLDRKFDGLENKYVLGELAYENLPDDITFSEPVEFSIEFREEDIPEGYTKDNIKLGYWNEEIKIWYAVPTEIRGNLAIANITHFSKWDMLLGGPHIRVNLVFDKRFNPTGASTESGKQIWLIGGPSEPNDPEFDKGSAVLQKDYFSSSYKEPEKSDFSQYFNTDNGEKEGLDIIKEEYKDE